MKNTITLLLTILFAMQSAAAYCQTNPKNKNSIQMLENGKYKPVRYVANNDEGFYFDDIEVSSPEDGYYQIALIPYNAAMETYWMFRINDITKHAGILRGKLENISMDIPHDYEKRTYFGYQDENATGSIEIDTETNMIKIDFLFDGDDYELLFTQDDRGPNEILPDGEYRFDIAFAEWRGASMGEKATVIINGNSVKVVYEGDGSLTGGKRVLYEGVIMRHKSGVWIIGRDPSDAQLDEIGGCSDGPPIIDFKNKKYWTC